MIRIRSGLVGLAAVLVVAFLVTACGGDGAGSPAAGPYGAATAAPVEPAETDLGEILVDSEGRTLYAYLNDSENRSNCEGKCAQAWPPVIVDGELDGSTGLDESLFGTTARPGGALQLTLDGRPLYSYVGDEASGDTKGQGAMDVWYVLAPDGALIGAPAGS